MQEPACELTGEGKRLPIVGDSQFGAMMDNLISSQEKLSEQDELKVLNQVRQYSRTRRNKNLRASESSFGTDYIGRDIALLDTIMYTEFVLAMAANPSGPQPNRKAALQELLNNQLRIGALENKQAQLAINASRAKRERNKPAPKSAKSAPVGKPKRRPK